MRCLSTGRLWVQFLALLVYMCPWARHLTPCWSVWMGENCSVKQLIKTRKALYKYRPLQITDLWILYSKCVIQALNYLTIPLMSNLCAGSHRLGPSGILLFHADNFHTILLRCKCQTQRDGITGSRFCFSCSVSMTPGWRANMEETQYNPG